MRKSMLRHRLIYCYYHQLGPVGKGANLCFRYCHVHLKQNRKKASLVSSLALRYASSIREKSRV